MLKDDELIGVIEHLSPGGAAVHRQADRAAGKFRRAGRHRHREHAAAQRAAPAHRRSQRIAGAADRDVGSAQSHLQLARRAGAVFQSILENATRICERQVRQSAACRGTTCSASAATRRAARLWEEFPSANLVRAQLRPRKLALSRQSARADRRHHEAQPKPTVNHCALRRACGARTLLGANAQGRRADRRHRHLPAGGAPVHRQADRTGAELRRAGGHRHREHAAAQRVAPAHRRSHRIAGAADGDLARCSRSSPDRPANCSQCSTPCWKMRREFARPGSAIFSCATAMRFGAWRFTTRPPHLLEYRQRRGDAPRPGRACPRPTSRTRSRSFRSST